jgi:ech hydrogenase subunit D
MIDNLQIIEPTSVSSHVQEIFNSGYRFVTITCCLNPDTSFDIFYSFDLDYKLLTLKTTLPSQDEIKSISDIYLAAAFAENEISELFGVKVKGMAIDYGGRFVLTEDSPQQPFGSGVIVERRDGSKNA